MHLLWILVTKTVKLTEDDGKERIIVKNIFATMIIPGIVQLYAPCMGIYTPYAFSQCSYVTFICKTRFTIIS